MTKNKTQESFSPIPQSKQKLQTILEERASRLLARANLINRVIATVAVPLKISNDYPDSERYGLPINYSGSLSEYLRLVSNNQNKGIRPGLVYTACNPYSSLLEEEIFEGLTTFAKSGDPLCISVLSFTEGNPATKQFLDISCRFVRGMITRTLTREEYHAYLGLHNPFPPWGSTYLPVPKGTEDYHQETKTLYTSGNPRDNRRP